MHRAELFGHHAIKREALSVRQRMGELLSRLEDSTFHRFESLFDINEGRLGVVVTFLAMLELAKEMLVEVVQEEPLAPIYVKAKTALAEENDELPDDMPVSAAADCRRGPLRISDLKAMQIEQLKPIIEAALLAASQPLTVAQLGELFVDEDQ